MIQRLVIIFLVFAGSLGFAAQLSEKSTSDQEASALLDILTKAGNSPDGDFFLMQERRLRYREELLKFWKKYPDYPHRFNLLVYALQYFPIYHMKPQGYTSGYETYRYAKFDVVKKAAWDREYQPLKRSLQESPLKDKYWRQINYCELYSELIIHRYAVPRGARVDPGLLNRFRSDILDFSNRFPVTSQSGHSRYLANQVAYFYREWGISEVDVVSFIQPFTTSQDEAFRNWAMGRLNFYNQIVTPLELTFTDRDGKSITLADLRGKVVFIDFWATWCEACVRDLKIIDQVRKKHGDQGFVVISVNLDSVDNKEKVQKLLRELNIDTRILQGGPKSANEEKVKSFFKKFGLYSLPQTLLLNKKGQIVESNLPSRDLDSALRRELCAGPNQAARIR